MKTLVLGLFLSLSFMAQAEVCVDEFNNIYSNQSDYLANNPLVNASIEKEPVFDIKDDITIESGDFVTEFSEGEERIVDINQIPACSNIVKK